MYSLEEVESLWENDCIIDRTQITNELLNIPKLHCKYLKILNEHKLASLRLKTKYEKLKHIKTEYYLGHLDKERINLI